LSRGAISGGKEDVAIAIYLPTLGEGGIERVYLNLAQAFVRQGIRVDLLVAQARGARQSEVPPGARVVDLAAHRRGTLWLVPGFLRYLRSTRPRAVLACSGLNLLAAWTKPWGDPRSRIVIAVHNTLSLQFANLTLLHRAVIPPLLSRFYPKADAIVAVSAGVADDLSRFLGLERARIEVLHNPVVTDDLLAKMAEPLEHSWFREAEPPVILGAGTLIPRKDFPTLVRAFALMRRHRQARLVILGEGEERAHLERLVRELALEGEVALPGFVSNPYPYFRRARLFVLSSRWEGLPTNVIEALACACPVVATACPGASEILENGRYGRLVAAGDVQAMAQAMLDTLSRPPDPQALQRRAMDFHVDRVAQSYLRVLRGEANGDGTYGTRSNA
jgi:glycosyltransferase involved in cell wall biosynthesis